MTTTDDDEIEVKPCPFCGCKAGVFGYGPFRVVCSQCTGALGPLYVLTKTEAADIWNRRPPTTP
jgi:hypothetical protein